MPVSSGNTYNKHTQNNVQAGMWALHDPVKWTHQINDNRHSTKNRTKVKPVTMAEKLELKLSVAMQSRNLVSQKRPRK